MRKRSAKESQGDIKGGYPTINPDRDEENAVPLIKNTNKVDWIGVALRFALGTFIVLLIWSKVGGSSQQRANTRRFIERFFEDWGPEENSKPASFAEIRENLVMAGGLPKRKLGNTGLEVSILGFGASPLGNVFGDLKEADGIEAVHEAIRQGINFIDVSPFYGATLAETNLGKALKDIPREKFVLSTKVGRYGQDVFDFSAERVTKSVDESLARLNVEYIDIIQCHDIEYGSLDQIVEETLPALQKLKEVGKVRFIGITGLPLKIFKYVLDRVAPGTVDVVLSYCHYCLNDQSLGELLPYLQEKGVGVINASPLAIGLLTSQGPPPWHPASDDIKVACKKAVDVVAQSQGKSITELALQFSTANPGIATTLVGMASPEIVRANIEAVTKGSIDESLLHEVEGVLSPLQNASWASGKPENN